MKFLTRSQAITIVKKVRHTLNRADDNLSMKLYKQLFDWVFNDDRSEVGRSFNSVCTAAGHSADAVRAEVFVEAHRQMAAIDEEMKHWASDDKLDEYVWQFLRFNLKALEDQDVSLETRKEISDWIFASGNHALSFGNAVVLAGSACNLGVDAFAMRTEVSTRMARSGLYDRLDGLTNDSSFRHRKARQVSAATEITSATDARRAAESLMSRLERQGKPTDGRMLRALINRNLERKTLADQGQTSLF